MAAGREELDCVEVDKFMQVYMDGELDQQDRLLVEQHLAACRSCRDRAEYQRRFIAAIKARVPREPAPDQLRQRVRQLLASDKRPLLRRRLLWGSLPAAAALAVLVTFTWTVTSAFSPVIDEAVQQHSRQPQVEMNASDPVTVENWFRRKVDFHVALPSFGSGQLSLVGARLSRLAKHRAALVRYANGPDRYSLFVFADAGRELPGSLCQRIHSLRVCMTEQRGYTVLMWRSRGLVYSFVGDSSPSRMLRLLGSTSREY